MVKAEGIIGFLGLFRESMADLPDGARIAFTGTVGGCPPLSELLAFSVKGRNFDCVYIPMADLSEARYMRWSEGIGYSVFQVKVEVQSVDALVVMGGLAMPKRGRPPEDIVALARSLGNPRIIGVGFQSIFERTGWLNKVPFDLIINAAMEVTASTPRESVERPSGSNDG